MAYVFLSYSSSDTDVVKRLIASLNKAGHQVWIDRQKIPGGARWSGEIVDAIEAAAAVLVALSPRAMDSDNVRKELALAVEAKKLILPVWIERTSVSKQLKYYLADIQQIDLASDFEAGLEAVLNALEPIVKGRLDSILDDPRLTTREKIDEWMKARAQFKDPDQVRMDGLDDRIREIDQERTPIVAEIRALEEEAKELRRKGAGKGTRDLQRVEREIDAGRRRLANFDVARGAERGRLAIERAELAGARCDKVIKAADNLSARYTRIASDILRATREDPEEA